MALVEISNIDKFVTLARKYNFESVDIMLNTIYNEIEWVLEAGIKYKKDYNPKGYNTESDTENE